LVSTLSAVSIPLYSLGFLFYMQAMKGYEPRQVRKEATVVIISCV
jgi:hypothetical protein